MKYFKVGSYYGYNGLTPPMYILKDEDKEQTIIGNYQVLGCDTSEIPTEPVVKELTEQEFKKETGYEIYF